MSTTIPSPRPEAERAGATRVRRMPAAILADAYLVLVVVFAVVATVGALRVRHAVPVLDDWRILDDLFSSSSLGTWLWADRHGHRMPGTLLLMYLDYDRLGGHMLLPVVASVLCTCVSIGALVVAFGTEPRTDAVARAALGLAAFILFWASSQYDLSGDVRHASVMSATWAIVALVLLVRPRQDDGSRPVPRLPVAAIAAALCATFSYGTGLGAWPALIVTALLLRLPRRAVGAVVVAAALGVWAYGTGLGPGGRTPSGRLLGVPGTVAAWVGAPVVRICTAFGDASPAVSAGAIVWIGAAAVVAGALRCVALARRRDGLRPRQVLGAGLMVASVAAAVLLGLTRSTAQTHAGDVRFATWSALFWIGLVCTLSAPAAGRTATAVVALILLGSATMLPARVEQQRRRAVEFDRGTMAATLHVLGVQWDESAAPSPERVYRVVERLDADGRSMFADPRVALPGALHVNRFVVAPRERCAGGVVWRHAILARTGPVLEVAGWTDQPGRASALAVVITDDRGVIRGHASHVHDLAPLIPGERPPVEHGWLGAVVGYNERATYHVHAVLPDRLSTCEVAVLEPEPPRSR